MILVLLLTPLVFRGLADDAFLQTALVVVLVTVFIAYPTTMETLTNGRSLGKRALGLRVVREDGGPIRLRHALTRTLVGVAVEWPGLIMPLVTWVVSTAHDDLLAARPAARRPGRGHLRGARALVVGRGAGCRPCRRRWPAGRPPWTSATSTTTWPWPPGTSWPGSADIRQPFYSRFAYGLAEEVAAKIPQPPPPGTPPWLYLAAVLAERRRRAGRQVLRDPRAHRTDLAGFRPSRPILSGRRDPHHRARRAAVPAPGQHDVERRRRVPVTSGPGWRCRADPAPPVASPRSARRAPAGSPAPRAAP